MSPSTLLPLGPAGDLLRTSVLLARQERWFLLGLPLVTGLLTVGTAPAYGTTYATATDLALAVAAARANPTSLFLYGTIAESGTAVELAVWELGALTCLILSVLVALRAVALTRGAEDSGRLELLRAQGIAPGVPVAAAGCVVTIESALLGAACGAGLLSLAEVGLGDAAAYAGAVGGTCLLMGAVTLLLSQLVADAVHARGLALLAVVLAFLGHGADAAQGWRWAGWLSPLRLRSAIGPGGPNRWEPLVLAVMASTILVVAALLLARHRDLGAGIIVLPHPRRSALRVGGPWALAWRLERRSLVTWAVAVTTIGTVLAAMGSSVVDLAQRGAVTGGSLGALLSGQDPGAAFCRYLGTIVGILVAVQALVVVQRVGTAEQAGLMEMVHATGTSPQRVVAAWWSLAVLGAGLSLAAASLGIGLVGRGGLDVGPGEVARTILGQWPAVAAVAGLTSLLVGAWPAGRLLAWLPVVAGGVIAQLGGVLDLPQPVIDGALFAHAGDTTSLWLAVSALGLLTIGALGAGARDLRPARAAG